MKRIALALCLLAVPASAGDFNNNTGSFNGTGGVMSSALNGDTITIIDMDKGAKFCGPMTIANGQELISIRDGSCIIATQRTHLSLRNTPRGGCAIYDSTVNAAITQDCSRNGVAR